MPPFVGILNEICKITLTANAYQLLLQVCNGGCILGLCIPNVSGECRCLNIQSGGRDLDIHVLKCLARGETTAIVKGERIEVHCAGDQTDRFFLLCCNIKDFPHYDLGCPKPKVVRVNIHDPN